MIMMIHDFFSSETNDREELFDKILEGKFEFVSPFWDHISTSAKVCRLKTLP